MIGKHIAITLIVGVGLGSIIWKTFPAGWTPMRTAGLCLSVAGFVLWTVARFQLGSSFTASAQARQLVTRGLYSRIRNPIYISGSCVIAGAALLLGRPIGLLIFVFIVPLQLWRAHKESQVLEAKFGEEYRRYRAGTWF
jgi:protein-S-isoprenylcysteine O-methyltransferase Ste14